jgi:hypothetical protein
MAEISFSIASRNPAGKKKMKIRAENYCHFSPPKTLNLDSSSTKTIILQHGPKDIFSFFFLRIRYMNNPVSTGFKLSHHVNDELQKKILHMISQNNTNLLL